jgi:hypothetical protein
MVIQGKPGLRGPVFLSLALKASIWHDSECIVRNARNNTLVVLVLLVSVLIGSTAQASPRSDMYTNVGLVGLTITNLGYVGSGFLSPFQPSGEYPLNSNVEHLFLGGIWVGAVTPDGTIRVSTGAQDASNLQAGDEVREFIDSPDDPVLIWSNSQNSDYYHSSALATQHFEVAFNDYANVESGNHTPLGIKIVMRALAWGSPFADDFVILDYAIINISGNELRDVYVGYWNDTTVGNTDVNNPYDDQAAQGWNYYDDMNGGWAPPGYVDEMYSPAGDPDIWMMYERDDDGDEGMATSWWGTRLLGTVPDVEPEENHPPVSYNAWAFRHVPDEDDEYYDEDDELEETLLDGKYQIMTNGEFDVGETQEEDYTRAHDWMGLLSTGPFPIFAAGDTIHVTYALVAGADSLSLLGNSKVAKVAYDDGFSIPGGPPSPVLDFGYEEDSIILRWAPGDSLDAESGDPLPNDSPLRSPEHHISDITGRPDFQGYRIYRYQGSEIIEDPYSIATLVAQFDKIDGVGFDTGLPALNASGLREFTDTNLLDGFPYWYSVTTYSALNVVDGLPEFQSGFNENAKLVFPGSSAAEQGTTDTIGVYPNPYRGGSMYDNRNSEQELGRKIWFTGLPARCTIQIFNLVGEEVDRLEHNNPNSGQISWDMLSDHTRAIASGLYIYVVTNLDTDEIQRGKLVIIK